MKLWWSPADVDKFIERAQCFIDQYSNYTVPEVNMNVSTYLSAILIYCFIHCMLMVLVLVFLLRPL